MEKELDYDALETYQEIIDEVVAGRTEGHKCPSCYDGILSCELDEVKILLKCEKCGKFFEGFIA